jgi:hypothetical protein
MHTDDTHNAPPPLTSVGIWPRRVGLGLAILAVLAFVWPNVTGQDHIAGVGNIVIGRVLIIAAWVPLLFGIIQRARFQRKQADNDQNV